jgi:hypothetical protein
MNFSSENFTENFAEIKPKQPTVFCDGLYCGIPMEKTFAKYENRNFTSTKSDYGFNAPVFNEKRSSKFKSLASQLQKVEYQKDKRVFTPISSPSGFGDFEPIQGLYKDITLEGAIRAKNIRKIKGSPKKSSPNSSIKSSRVKSSIHKSSERNSNLKNKKFPLLSTASSILSSTPFKPARKQSKKVATSIKSSSLKPKKSKSKSKKVSSKKSSSKKSSKKSTSVKPKKSKSKAKKSSTSIKSSSVKPKKSKSKSKAKKTSTSSKASSTQASITASSK